MTIVNGDHCTDNSNSKLKDQFPRLWDLFQRLAKLLEDSRPLKEKPRMNIGDLLSDNERREEANRIVEKISAEVALGECYRPVCPGSSKMKMELCTVTGTEIDETATSAESAVVVLYHVDRQSLKLGVGAFLEPGITPVMKEPARYAKSNGATSSDFSTEQALLAS